MRHTFRAALSKAILLILGFVLGATGIAISEKNPLGVLHKSVLGVSKDALAVAQCSPQEKIYFVNCGGFF